MLHYLLNLLFNTLNIFLKGDFIMLENIINFMKSNIALLISFISLCLSLYNFAYNLLCRKCKIRIIVHNYSHYFDTHRFYVTIQNCSQLPVSISSICINKSCFCILEPSIVKVNTEHSGNTVISRNETKTIAFPINLNSLQSYSGYLDFRGIDNFNKNNFSLSIFTNRKAIKNAKVITNDDLTKML